MKLRWLVVTGLVAVGGYWYITDPLSQPKPSHTDERVDENNQLHSNSASAPSVTPIISPEKPLAAPYTEPKVSEDSVPTKIPFEQLTEAQQMAYLIEQLDQPGGLSGEAASNALSLRAFNDFIDQLSIASEIISNFEYDFRDSFNQHLDQHPEFVPTALECNRNVCAGVIEYPAHLAQATEEFTWGMISATPRPVAVVSSKVSIDGRNEIRFVLNYETATIKAK
ncbi:hypothetical protein AB8S08_09525 [Pseudidiomarina sp. PP-1MA]|uniref:Uncharacterized protein n=1 Tax=Pseudidiomarina sp. PP-1MA TaxID=3237706 RepID=A0AB39X6G1_9GAMM